jgi:hypothetical protein
MRLALGRVSLSRSLKSSDYVLVAAGIQMSSKRPRYGYIGGN